MTTPLSLPRAQAPSQRAQPPSPRKRTTPPTTPHPQPPSRRVRTRDRTPRKRTPATPAWTPTPSQRLRPHATPTFSALFAALAATIAALFALVCAPQRRAHFLAVVLTLAALLLVVVLLALPAGNARAHADTCSQGYHATLLTGDCVPAGELGFADWCQAKFSGFYYRAGNSARCRGAGGANADWCDPFTYSHDQRVDRVTGPICTQGSPPKYSDGSCLLPATDPHSYHPGTHSCNGCPAGEVKINGRCQQPCPGDRIRVDGRCPGGDLAEFVDSFNQPPAAPPGLPRPADVFQTGGGYAVNWFPPANRGDGRILGYEIWWQHGAGPGFEGIDWPDDHSRLVMADPAFVCDDFTAYWRWDDKRTVAPGQYRQYYNSHPNGYCVRWRICAKHTEESCAVNANTSEADPSEWVYTDPIFARPREQQNAESLYRVVNGDKYYRAHHLEGVDFCTRVGVNKPQNFRNRTYAIAIQTDFGGGPEDNKDPTTPEYHIRCVLDGQGDTDDHDTLCGDYPSHGTGNIMCTGGFIGIGQSCDHDALCGIGRADGGEITSACAANSRYDALQRGCVCEGRNTPARWEYSGSPASAISPRTCVCEVANANSSCECSGTHPIYDPEAHACRPRPEIPARELTFAPTSGLHPDTAVKITLRLAGRGTDAAGGAPAAGGTYEIFYGHAQAPIVGCSGNLAEADGGLEGYCSTKLPVGRAVLWGEYVLASDQHNRPEGRIGAEIEVAPNNRRDCETPNPLTNPVGGTHATGGTRGERCENFPQEHFFVQNQDGADRHCKFTPGQDHCPDIWARMRVSNCVARGLVFKDGHFSDLDLSCVCPETGAEPDFEDQCLSQADLDLRKFIAPGPLDADLLEHYFPASDFASRCPGNALPLYDGIPTSWRERRGQVCRTAANDGDVCWQSDGTPREMLWTRTGYHLGQTAFTTPKCSDHRPPCLDSSGDPDNSKNPFTESCGPAPPAADELYEHYFPAADRDSQCPGLAVDVFNSSSPPRTLSGQVCRNAANNADVCWQSDGTPRAMLWTGGGYHLGQVAFMTKECAEVHPPCLDSSGDPDNSKNPFTDDCDGEPGPALPPTAAELYEYYFPAADDDLKCEEISSVDDGVLPLFDSADQASRQIVGRVCYRNLSQFPQRPIGPQDCYQQTGDGDLDFSTLRLGSGQPIAVEPPVCSEKHPPCLDFVGALDESRNPFTENCTGETVPMVNLASLVAAVDAGADPDLAANGVPLLIRSALDGNAEAVSVLITVGANPNIRGNVKDSIGDLNAQTVPHAMADNLADLPWPAALRVLAHFADALDAPTARTFIWNTNQDAFSGSAFDLRAIELADENFRTRSSVSDSEKNKGLVRRMARILKGRGETCTSSRSNNEICMIEQATCPGGTDSWTCRDCAAAPILSNEGDACVAACPTGQVPFHDAAAPGDSQCGCADGNPIGEWGDCNEPRHTAETACTTVDPLVNPLGGTWTGGTSVCELTKERFHQEGHAAGPSCFSRTCAVYYRNMRAAACHERGLLYSRTVPIDGTTTCICAATGEEGSCYGPPEVPDAPSAAVSPNNLVEVVWSRPRLNQSTLAGYAVHRQVGSGAAFVSIAFSPSTMALVTLSETVSESDAGRNLRYKIQTQSEFGLGSLSAQSDPAVQARACLSGEGRFSQPDGGYVCLPTARHPAAQSCVDAGWTVSRIYESNDNYAACAIPLHDADDEADLESCLILFAGATASLFDCNVIFPGFDFPQKPAEAARYVFNCPHGFAPDQSYESGTGSERQVCVDENSPLLIAALEGPVSGAPLTLLAHLISLGADADAMDSGGVPALLLAGAAGHSAAVSLLISLGADPDARDPNNDNRTLPHLAGRDWTFSPRPRWATGLEVLRSFALAVDASGAAFDWNALAGGSSPLDDLRASFELASDAANRLLISEMAGLIRERGGRCANQLDAHRVCRAEGQSPEQLLVEQVSRLVPNLATVAMLVTQVLDVSGTDGDGVSYLLLAGVAAHPEVVSILVAAGANPNARHPGRFNHNLAHLQTRNQASAHPWERRLRVLEHFDNALTDSGGVSFGGWDGLNQDAAAGGGSGGVRPRDYLAAPYATATAEADRHAILRMAALLHVRDGRCALSANAQSDTCRTPDALLLEQVRRASPNLTLAALHAERADADAVVEGLPLLALAATLGHSGVVSVLVFAGADAGARASDGRNVAHLLAQNETGSWPVSRDVLLAFGEAIFAANASFDWNVSSGGLNALELLGNEFNAISLTATPAEVEAIQAMANYFNRRGLSCQYIQSAICDLSDAPDAPENFQLNLTGPVTTVVTLSWLAAEENGSEVTAYYLWRSEPVALPPGLTACPETIYGSYLDDPPEFRLEGTARAFGEDLGSAGYGFCYEYAIAALNADGEGPKSLVRRLVQTVPAAVGTPSVTTSFSGVPRVSWDALTDRATEIRGARIVAYQLAREDDMGLANNWGRRRDGLEPATPLSTVFADSSATLEYRYRYRVRARGLTGLWGAWGAWSEGVMPAELAAGCGPGERNDGTPTGCQRVGSLCSSAAENKRWLQDLDPGDQDKVECRCETNEDGLDGNENYCAPRGLPAPLPGVNENPRHPLTVFAACQDAGYAPLANDDYLATPPRNDNPSQGVSDSRYLYCNIHTEELIGGVSQGVRDRCVVAVQTHQRELIAKRSDGYFNFLHPEAGDALVTLRFCHELFAEQAGVAWTGSFPAESAGVLHEAHNPYRHGSCGPGETLSRQHNRCVRDCFSGVYTDLGQGSVSGLRLIAGSDVQSDSCACPAGEFLDGGVCAGSCGVGRVAVTDLTLAANEPDWTPLSCVDRPNIGDWEDECGSIDTDITEVVFVGSYRENNLAVLCPLNRDLYNRERQVLYNSRFCWLSAEPNFHLNNPPSSEPLHVPPCWELTAAGEPVDPPNQPQNLPGSYRESQALAEYGECLTRPSADLGKLVEKEDGNCGCLREADYAQLGSYCIHRTDPAPKDAVICDGVFGGTVIDDVVCGGIDWNDTFCLVGSPDAFPCQGLFDHVRDCNVLGRPAVDPWVCGPRCVLGHAAGARCVFGAREFLLDQNGSLELRTAALTAAAEYDPALHTVTLLQTATRPVFSVVSGEFEVSQDGVVRRTPGNRGQSGLAVVQVTHPRNERVYFRLTVEVAWVRAPAYNEIVLGLDDINNRNGVEVDHELQNQRVSGFGHPGGLTGGLITYEYQGVYLFDNKQGFPDDLFTVDNDGQLGLSESNSTNFTRPRNYNVRLIFRHPDMKGPLLLSVPLRVTN